jgi:hypothetical protein
VREEAEAKVKAEAEAKAKAKIEAERKVREEAERKVREEAERKAREEGEKARREAEELRLRLEEERKAREAEERKRREEEERRRKEEEERRAREEAERKAREEAERQRREEEERKRREEEDRRRKEEEERRMREEIEAKAREAAEAARRGEEDRRIREKEEQARQVHEEEDAKARKAREEEEETQAALRAIEEEASRARKAMDETKARQPTLQAAPKPPPAPEPAPPAKGSGGSLDALMADLDSFSQREEQERETRDAGERKAKEEKKRRMQEDSERRAREQAAHEQRQAEERRRQEEEERRAQEEAERRVREAEEARRLEAEERKRRARELAATKQVQASVEKQAPAPARAAAPADDIGVTDKDLDMDDVRRDEALVAKDSRKAQREREREQRQREKEARERAKAATKEEAETVKYSRPRRKVKWGRPVAVTLFVLLVAGVGVLHIMPLPMEEYEQAASAALGRPVKISSGRLSLFNGVRLNLEGVSIGDSVKIAHVHAYPAIGSLFDEKKALNRIELEGVTIGQQALGETLFAKIKGDNFSVGRIVVKQLKLDGPVPLPAFDADAGVGPDGALRVVTLRGPEQLTAKITPGKTDIDFDVTASSLTIPFAPELTLNSFAMKGNATRQGMNIVSWGGGFLDGALSGTANVRWSGNWQMDGVMTVRGINAAVFAPALLSEGKAEGTGRFSMSGADPAKLSNGLRMEGNFNVNKGVLGSFDLSRVIQTSGRQYAGRTQFTELTGQGTYDRGAVALRNVNMTAGALSAGASADIAPGGALSGRIVADIRTAGQSLRQTLNLGGTIREPQVRN